MFEQELEALLEKKWSDEERKLISGLMENVIYYKKLIPKSLKQDILNALQICNVLKNELEIYREKCKCLLEKTEDTCEDCKCEDCKCEDCKCQQETQKENVDSESPEES